MRPFGALLPQPEALARLLKEARPISGTEVVPLPAALGRIPSDTIRARWDVPRFARATWDGYALRTSDVRGARPERPISLRLVGEVFAEAAGPLRVGAGEAAAIATGGRLPPGADAVLIFEQTSASEAWLTVRRAVRAGEKVAAPGADFARGTVLARPGEPITPPTLGALAACGLTSVRVVRRLRVGLLPNGNELVAPGGVLGPEQIHESNNFVLASLVAAVGGVADAAPPAPDDPRRIEAEIRRLLRRDDVVLVTGGSSVGEHDYLPAIFPRIGKLLFHGIAVRPGKPTLAAVADGKLLIGLPGHPTSCLANGYWLLLPVLRRLAHLPGSGTTSVEVRMQEGYELDGGASTMVVPVHVEGGRARPTFRDSSAITSLSAANAFALMPPGSRSLRKGARVTVELLPGPLAAPPVSLRARAGRSKD